MNQTVAVWMLIAVAFIAASIPFLNDRLFALIPLRSRVTGMGTAETESDAANTAFIQKQDQRNDKSFFVRVLELLVLYGLVGLLAYVFESTIGNPFTQRWEFYAITFSLFVVLAFPGFVVRYLFRRS